MEYLFEAGRAVTTPVGLSATTIDATGTIICDGRTANITGIRINNWASGIALGFRNTDQSDYGFNYMYAPNNSLVMYNIDGGNVNNVTVNITSEITDSNILALLNAWATPQTSPKQFDLSTHTWTTSGVKQISVVAHGTGSSDSAKSNIVTYNVYDIELALTGVTKSGVDAIGEKQITIHTFTADARHYLPDSIMVNGVTGASGSTGCTWTWDKATGTLLISKPTQNVFVTVTGAEVRGRFVCVGASGKSYYLRDGSSWAAMSGLDTSITYCGVTYGNDRFVCVSYSGTSYYSTNGTSWIAMSGLESAHYQGVTYGNGRFVCVSDPGKSYYSTNGTSWIAMSGLESAMYYAVAYGNGRFVCTGQNGKSYYSTNGTSWTAMSGLNTSTHYQGVTYGNGRFVCVSYSSGRSYYSTNGTSWTAMSGLSTSATYYGVAYGNGRFVCVGSGGKSYYSTNGTSWTAMSGLNTSTAYRGVAYGNGRFVCVGYDGKSYYSINGTSWTAMSGLASAVYWGVAYGELV